MRDPRPPHLEARRRPGSLMANATQRAEKRQGLPRGTVPTASTVPSTVPTSTPPAPPPPAPGGTPGQPGAQPGSNPTEPRPVGTPAPAPGTPAPAPATPQAPARPQPQTQPEEQDELESGTVAVATADDGGDDDGGDDGGGDENDVEPGDASTERDTSANDRLFARIDSALAARTNPLIESINRLHTSTMRLQSHQEQLTGSVKNLKKSVATIATLAAQQENLRSTLAVVEGRLIDPVQFRQELQADIQAAVAAEVEQLTTQPVTVQVPTAPAAVQVPTPPPAPAVTTSQAPQPQVAAVASPTLDEIRSLIQAELAGLRTPTPTVAPPVPTTVNTPSTTGLFTVGDRLEAGLSALHPETNPFTKVIWDTVRAPYDVVVGGAGMLSLPPDVDIRIMKNQAGTTEAARCNVYSQQFLRGVRCGVPLMMGLSAGYTAYQAGAGITTLGEFGGTTMVTLKAGSLWGAFAAGASGFALGALGMAVWAAWSASKALARKEELAQAELRSNQAAQAAFASLGQSAVSQPRTS